MWVDPARCTGLTAQASSSAGDVVLADLAAPGACRDATALHVFLEPLEIPLCLALDESEGVSDRLDRALRLDVELQGHPCLAVPQAMERHDAGVPGAFGGCP